MANRLPESIYVVVGYVGVVGYKIVVLPAPQVRRKLCMADIRTGIADCDHDR